MKHTAKLLILFGLPLAVVIWFTDNTLAIILTPFLVFLLHITYITRGKFFILDAAYAFWISIKLQFYFRPQLDWIRKNIGKIYITEEIVKHPGDAGSLKHHNHDTATAPYQRSYARS